MGKLGLRSSWVVLLPLPLLAGCGNTDGGGPLGQSSEPVVAPLPSAYCNIVVDGVGAVPTETDYVPGVVYCENGGANLQALKAQAIAARSVAYYNMARQGSICNSQSCQVYSCTSRGTPGAIHKQAAAETAGMYLSYDSMLTYGFYVDGDHNTAPPSCIGSASAPRENYVTYNEGKTGADVAQSTLGFVSYPIYGQNRGCMSQWGARCLENSNGYDYRRILEFYYGADIQILTAPGSCVQPQNQEPTGWLDAADCNTIGGWAYDPDDPDRAVDVLLYIDTPAGSGAATVVAADQYRNDLCSAIGSCAHGFSIPTPANLKDGAQHSVIAVAVDTSGAPERELSGNPKTLTCASGSGGTGGGTGGSAGGGGTGAGGTGGSSATGGLGAAAGFPSATGGSGASSSGGNQGSQTNVYKTGDDSGCACRAGSTGRTPAALGWLLMGAAWIAARRRRARRI